MGEDTIEKCFQDLRTAHKIEIILGENARMDKHCFIACNHEGQEPPRTLCGYVRKLTHEIVGLHLSEEKRLFDLLDYTIALDAIAQYRVLEKLRGP